MWGTRTGVRCSRAGPGRAGPGHAPPPSTRGTSAFDRWTLRARARAHPRALPSPPPRIPRPRSHEFRQAPGAIAQRAIARPVSPCPYTPWHTVRRPTSSRIASLAASHGAIIKASKPFIAIFAKSPDRPVFSRDTIVSAQKRPDFKCKFHQILRPFLVPGVATKP